MGRFCASERTAQSIEPVASNRPGAPGGETVTGKARFSRCALATMSSRPIPDITGAGLGLGCIIATGSCRAWLSPSADGASPRSEEHTSELQSLMRISYAVFCLNKKNIQHIFQHWQ